MSDKPHLQLPEYEIPLGQAHLAELGRFTAIFSQIDFLMGDAIHLITKAPWAAMELMLENATTGPKLSILRKLAPSIQDKAAKKLAISFVEEMNSLIDKRNHVVHGLWCMQIVEAQKTTKAGCYYPRYPNKPVLAADITKLANRGAKASRLIGQLLMKLSPEYAKNPWTKPRRLFVSIGDMDLNNIPDWLGGPVQLRKAGYPNLGGSPSKPKPQP